LPPNRTAAHCHRFLRAKARNFWLFCGVALLNDPLRCASETIAGRIAAAMDGNQNPEARLLPVRDARTTSPPPDTMQRDRKKLKPTELATNPAFLGEAI
jgi:hypothetical protein